MKLFTLVTLATAALVGAQTERPVTWEEWEAFHVCTEEYGKDLGGRVSGDVSSCNLVDCYRKQCELFGRGGFITPLSNVLEPFCTAARVLPYWPSRKPVTEKEAMAYERCTGDFLADVHAGSDGSRAACKVWSCFHQAALDNGRKAPLTTASNALTPICIAVGIVLS